MLEDNADFQVVNTAVPFFGVNLKRLWGSAALVSYIADILQDAKNSTFKGIADPVLQAFANLLVQHKLDFPQLYPALDENKAFVTIRTAYPQIAARISEVWGQKALLSYLNEFLHDTRDVHRKGFPGDVLLALFDISELHQKYNPHLYPTSTIWSHEEH